MKLKYRMLRPWEKVRSGDQEARKVNGKWTWRPVQGSGFRVEDSMRSHYYRRIKP